MAKRITRTQKVKVIYNQHAGEKNHLTGKANYSLEDIQNLLDQYQLPADFFATRGPGHATILAQEAIKQKYPTVLVAGGDGTVSEAIAGLVNSEVVLGVLPFGTYMNVAHMLSVSQELESAVMLAKIAKIRKIDLGEITRINGEKPNQPIYFVENSGIGMEAELQEAVLKWKKGDWRQLWEMVRIILDFYSHELEITIDGKKITHKASLVEVSNGPWTGAALNIAPDAKLNDHRLTVSVFHMEKWELLRFLILMLDSKPARSNKITRYQGSEITIKSYRVRLVHADAKVFGTTPVEYRILPNALNVITGFPKLNEKASLKPRTWLES